MMYCIEKKENKGCSIGCRLFPGLLLGVGLVSPLVANAAIWSAEELAVFDLVNLQRGFHNLDPVQRDDRLHDSARGHSQSMADNNFFSHTTLVGSNGINAGVRMRDADYDWTRWGENIAVGQGRTFPGPTQSSPIDAAHDVMYGTEDFTEINTFFTTTAGVTASGWDDLGDGLTGEDWDAWYRDQNRSGGWMGSRGHRNTILDDMFDDLGVGYVWEPDDVAPILLDEGELFNFPFHTYWTQNFASGDSLAPVPVPAAVWLLGSGLAGMMLIGRRRTEAAA